MYGQDSQRGDSEVNTKANKPENCPDISYKQSGKFGIGHESDGKIGDNAQVAGQIDNIATQTSIKIEKVESRVVQQVAENNGGFRKTKKKSSRIAYIIAGDLENDTIIGRL